MTLQGNLKALIMIFVFVSVKPSLFLDVSSVHVESTKVLKN